MSFEAKDLIKALLGKDARFRPTMKEVLQHPWLTVRTVSQDSTPAFADVRTERRLSTTAACLREREGKFHLPVLDTRRHVSVAPEATHVQTQDVSLRSQKIHSLCSNETFILKENLRGSRNKASKWKQSNSQHAWGFLERT